MEARRSPVTESDVPPGYPSSPADELTPLEPPLPLERGDRELEKEGDVTPPGSAPPPDSPDEDRLADSPDADQLAATEVGGGGSAPGDAPNFEDNSAEWSRERS
jgi:hypothetical protein